MEDVIAQQPNTKRVCDSFWLHVKCQLYHDYGILPCLKNGCWFDVLLLARFPKLYIHFYCSEELRQVIYWQCFNRIISSQPHLKIVNVWILTSCFAHVTVVEFIQITYKNLKLLTHVDWGSAPHFLCNSNLACVFLEVAYPVNTMPSTNLKSPLVKALLLFCSKGTFTTSLVSRVKRIKYK